MFRAIIYTSYLKNAQSVVICSNAVEDTNSASRSNAKETIVLQCLKIMILLKQTCEKILPRTLLKQNYTTTIIMSLKRDG